MKTRLLGRSGLEVSAQGLGCMGMSAFYGTASNDSEAKAVLDRALDLGVTFLDTSDMYGPHTNEELLGRLIAGRRERFAIATKFGILFDPKEPTKRGICGRPDYVKSACDASLARLNIDTIDLYYQHRVDPAVPIEDTVGAMADLVAAGKVRYLGLSEAGTTTLRRAAAVHPIAALQTEYSLWTRDPEDRSGIPGDNDEQPSPSILETCRDLGIGFVAYSPLGRGFLTGAIKSRADFEPGDFRLMNPRFSKENFAKNLELVAGLEDIARHRSCSAAQLALAWVMAQGDDIVPIPGTRSVARLEENASAADMVLSPEERAAIDMIMPPGAAHGLRYQAASMAALDRNS